MSERHLHVICAIIEQDGCVLAAQRSRTMAMPLKWEFPGGKIKPGETPEHCLCREIAEEQPSRYAEFVSQVLKQAFLEEPDPERRRWRCLRRTNGVGDENKVRSQFQSDGLLRDKKISPKVEIYNYCWPIY